MSSGGFDPQRPVLSEGDWLLDPRWDGVVDVVPSGLAGLAEDVVVLTAHPDDETLGAGASIADLAASGLRVTFVAATDGEASHPRARRWTKPDLAEVRRRELRAALDVLSPGSDVVELGLPDGGLRDHVDAIAAELRARLTPRSLLLAPYRADGHPDHDACGAAAGQAAEQAGARLLEYPIWFWQWATGDQLPWDRVISVDTTPQGRARRGAALTAYRSQLVPLELEEWPVVGGALRTRAERVVETLIADAPPARRIPRSQGVSGEFDDLYERVPDPWRYDGWYERRKRDLLIAMLPHEDLGAVLELGCGAGFLTEALLPRSHSVMAIDPSRRALAAGALRCPGPGVQWVCGASPQVLREVPDHWIDTAILSEVGYFMSGGELLGTVRSLKRIVRPGGVIVLSHWQRPVEGLELDGPAVHRQLRAVLGEGVLTRLDEADLCIEAFTL